MKMQRLAGWFLAITLAFALGVAAQPNGGAAGGPGPVNPCPGNNCSTANVTATGGGTNSLSNWFQGWTNSSGESTLAIDLTGSTTAANFFVNTTAVGSGTNGPATAQNAGSFYLMKDGYPSSGAVGELDPVQILGRQSGAGSDMSGLLINVENTGLGFLSTIEMVSSIYNTGSSTITRQIDIQDGVLNAPGPDYIGRVYTANTGNMTSAILVQNTTGLSTWGNILTNTKNGTQNFQLTDGGVINASNYSVGGDLTNGNLDLGIANTSGTPYIVFYGDSQTSCNARIISDSASQITVQGDTCGAGSDPAKFVVLGGITASLATTGTIAGSVCATSGGALLYESGATGCTISLESVKKNIAGIDAVRALHDVMSIHPIEFEFKDPSVKGRRYGFGANQVHGVNALLSTYDGNGDLQAFDPNGILAELVFVVQHQQHQIDEVTHKVR